eukprot:6569265-Karenia_brevis.AAC.1
MVFDDLDLTQNVLVNVQPAGVPDGQIIEYDADTCMMRMQHVCMCDIYTHVAGTSCMYASQYTCRLEVVAAGPCFFTRR